MHSVVVNRNRPRTFGTVTTRIIVGAFSVFFGMPRLNTQAHSA